MATSTSSSAITIARVDTETTIEVEIITEVVAVITIIIAVVVVSIIREVSSVSSTSNSPRPRCPLFLKSNLNSSR